MLILQHIYVNYVQQLFQIVINVQLILYVIHVYHHMYLTHQLQQL